MILKLRWILGDDGVYEVRLLTPEVERLVANMGGQFTLRDVRDDAATLDFGGGMMTRLQRDRGIWWRFWPVWSDNA